MLQFVASGCFKTRSGVASPSSPLCQAWEARAGGGGLRWRGRSPRACAGVRQHAACAAVASGQAAAAGVVWQAQQARRGLAGATTRATG
jgi:hypothetical protein